MTDWNERYKIGDTPWEKGAAAPPLIELLGKTQEEIWGSGRTLVPGCGSGHDVRALATAGITAVGVDLAREAIRRAEVFPRISDETYEQGDFLEKDFAEGKTFSAIWEHTCFCAIDPQRRENYAESCSRLLQSGGHLIGVFFLTAQDPGEEQQGPPFNSTISELDERFARWFDRIKEWVPESSYPGRKGKEWLAIYRKR
ncbi:methyltransferase domain-containing protein [Luteolibacter sp. AS25]|uniref:methyltransferase domain-containing protein n=1 Tax=Luteolibacter sp. AS25 TaxID=3135776 RepID=UPI00398A8920